MMFLRWAACALVVSISACNRGGASTPETPATAPAETAGSTAGSTTAAAAADPAAKPAEPMATREDDTDRASKNGRLEAEIGGVPVVVEYGRPEVKGRKVFGGLVPYGEVWRTGADEATTLRLEAPAKIGDTVLEPEVYSLFTIPGEKSWTFIVNEVARQWGAYDYDAKKDVVRVKVKPESHPMTEQLTFSAQPGHLVLTWAEVAVKLPIAVPPAR